jgi:hypothetical protein
MAEAAAMRDSNMRPANMNMGPAGTEAPEATAGEVGAAKTAKMASAKMPATSAEMTATSVTATSMTAASAPGEGHCWYCGSTQKSSHYGHDNGFSQHKSLRKLVRGIKVSVRAYFPLSKRVWLEIHRGVSRAL